MDPETIASVINSLGVATVLGWYLFYDTTVAKPRAEATLMGRIDQLIDRQNASTERSETRFIQAIKEEREACDLRIQMLQDEILHLRGLHDTKRSPPEKTL